jgi:hypothetical protein
MKPLTDSQVENIIHRLRFGVHCPGDRGKVSPTVERQCVCGVRFTDKAWRARRFCSRHCAQLASRGKRSGQQVKAKSS